MHKFFENKKWFNTLYFKGMTCFKGDWVGFDDIKKITVLIGKNNSGKSSILDEIGKISELNIKFKNESSSNFFKGKLRKYLIDSGSSKQYKVGVTITNEILQNNDFILDKPIHYWTELPSGRNYCNFSDVSKLEWSIHPNKADDSNQHYSKIKHQVERSVHGFYNNLNSLIVDLDFPFIDKAYKRIFSERDIVSEEDKGIYKEYKLSQKGEGASILVRRFCNLNVDPWKESGIIEKIQNLFNEIMGNETKITELTAKQSEDNKWEIHLREEKKGLIPLSLSGSGLKTILLVLLNTIAIPYLENKKLSDYIFAFEELENNLHPSVLRRLFNYISTLSNDDGPYIILTTHSSITIDYFNRISHAQIIRVIHDGINVKTETVTSSINQLNILSDLGAKPSDILQANGLIWVEGPSERIYISHWIELCSNNKFYEGKDFQFVMYGGSLLSHYQIGSESDKLIDLLKINSNIILICDSDITEYKSQLKPVVQRILDEAKALGALIWVTQPKEIENYIPGEVLGKVFAKQSLPDPKEKEIFFTKSKKHSYYSKNISKDKSIDKVSLAKSCILHMNFENMKVRFDWEDKLKLIVERIQQWNT